MDIYNMPFVVSDCECEKQEMQPLAIVRIREQNWETPYTDEQALWRGHNLPVAEPAVRMLQKQITIGKELKIMNREQLFYRIQQLGFTVDDIVLYLDTHPNCQRH